MDAEDERRGEIGERPDEDEEGAGQVAGRRQGQRDRRQLPPSTRAHAFGRFFERGIDLAERVDHVERDHRKEVERLHQEHAVDAVHEVDRGQQIEPVHEEDVDRPGPAQDEGEAEDAHQRRRDDRDQRQVAEQIAPDEVVTDEQEGDGKTEHAGRRHRSEPEQERVPERTAIEAVAGEVDEVAGGQPAGVVGKGVVEDPRERIHEEDGQEDPDGGDAERRPRCGPRLVAGARLSARWRHRSGRVRWRPESRRARAGRPRAPRGAAGRARPP